MVQIMDPIMKIAVVAVFSLLLMRDSCTIGTSTSTATSLTNTTAPPGTTASSTTTTPSPAVASSSRITPAVSGITTSSTPTTSSPAVNNNSHSISTSPQNPEAASQENTATCILPIYNVYMCLSLVVFWRYNSDN
ncbi:uncharacterized protein LOC125681193 isoform X2 [Ostrea edulis]|uniref:uncharacterized protein LOC125681193 isoform X2 n=1 Tax=Ostrea edulis TaxID=37623 RepID=UPI0024AFE94A|nr:uncharacterized protein LOC125681193 isoform X2 [Ostrea edulis]